MKIQCVFLLLCIVAPFVLCRIDIDDFQVPDGILHNFPAEGEFKFSSTATSSLSYARRMGTRKVSGGGPQWVDAQIGGGQFESTQDHFTVGDYVELEYFFGSPNDWTVFNVDNQDVTFPSVTRPDVPIPAGYIDLTNIGSLQIDIAFQNVYPGFGFLIDLHDVNGGFERTHHNYDILDVNPEIAITELVHGTNVRLDRVDYIKIRIILPQFVMTAFYFKSACQAPTNVNAAAALSIPFVLDTPASFPVATCGECAPGDFTGGFSGIQRDNVFWFTVPQQNAAYTATFSSQSFSGIDDAYLWIFNAQGGGLAYIDNFSNDTFSATVVVDEAPIFVAFGADCYLESYALDVSFTAVVGDLSVQLAEVEENLGSLINSGFTGVGTQIGGVSGQLTSSTSDIIAAVGQAKSDLQGVVGTETDQIDGEIAGVVTAVGNARQTLSDHIDGKFTDLDGNLNTRFGNVGSSLDTIVDQIGDQCGSSSDGVVSLTAYLTAQWTNWRNTQIIEKLVPGALVPAHLQTPASQGGALEDVLTLVSNTFNAKKSLADAGRTTPTSSSCKSGTDGAYCRFFYRFTNGAGSAQSNYQTAIAAYNNSIQQARYVTAFQNLATAYNALFMGQI